MPTVFDAMLVATLRPLQTSLSASESGGFMLMALVTSTPKNGQNKRIATGSNSCFRGELEDAGKKMLGSATHRVLKYLRRSAV